MTMQQHTPEQISTKARRYTVGYIFDSQNFQPSPSIVLKGHWMGELGFETGRKVEVLCELGELIIRLVEE